VAIGARRAATARTFLERECVLEVVQRGIIEIDGNRVTYQLRQKKSYDLGDPEEPIRAFTIARLIVEGDYPARRLRTEVSVPRREPSDFADIVVYKDDDCSSPYLVVENKSPDQSQTGKRQAIEQGFGNANSLRADFLLYDEGTESIVFDVGNYPSMERERNRLGPRETLPRMYGAAPEFIHIAGHAGDIEPPASAQLEAAVRRVHGIIWSGGRRDPLNAFDEWSKLLFAKVMDERQTPTGLPRRFQEGTHETETAVANRVHRLFANACREDSTIFPVATRIDLSDSKITECVRALQSMSLTRTDVDSVGSAFEQFFGTVFRGDLGQYFTRRELARFTVAILEPTHDDFVMDPTAGSGGFLLEALLQVWHGIDRQFSGQYQQDRLKIDFALHRVFGIEIHRVLARICKINLLLHHDGHTNIEGDRSCLDSVFSLPRLAPPFERFSIVVGNPPFGDEVKDGDEDKLGQNTLSNFDVASGRTKVDSEHVVLERAIQMLEPGGKLGLVVPDGLLNNQGAQSNCPQVRSFIAKNGRILAVVSLPDYAFRKSGAQNKTSIIFFEKFTREEAAEFSNLMARINEEHTQDEEFDSDEAIALAFAAMPYNVFLAEAEYVGYSPSGGSWRRNDLYADDGSGMLQDSQAGTILDEYRRFVRDQEHYQGSEAPACMAGSFRMLWSAHASHRLDPKYHIFKREDAFVPPGWVRARIGDIMRRREDVFDPSDNPEEGVMVLTIAQTGELRLRGAGKGKAPPEWRAMYFEDSPSTWYRARQGDVVYSSIDLWKGCIAVVPEEFDGALVTKEFPVYEVCDDRIAPEFLSVLLRSRYYQRGFRAITTGHSNRRRTQQGDFEALEIAFPPTRDMQRSLVQPIVEAVERRSNARSVWQQALLDFDCVVDARNMREVSSNLFENADDE
jgi:type I restriction enzyme M protein